jgi:hypothetical protein
MTKRELIEALEALPCSDDTEVSTGYMEVTEVFYNEKEDYVELN